MNNFTFYSPTMFAFGQGEASRVGALVRQFGGSKVLLVAGGGSVKKNGASDAATAALKAAGIPWHELWGVQANPRSGKVYEGIDLARTEGVDFLLAIGGGSVSISNTDAELDITATAPNADNAIRSKDGKNLDEVIQLAENGKKGLVKLVKSGTTSISRLFHNGVYADSHSTPPTA